MRNEFKKIDVNDLKVGDSFKNTEMEENLDQESLYQITDIDTVTYVNLNDPMEFGVTLIPCTVTELPPVEKRIRFNVPNGSWDGYIYPSKQAVFSLISNGYSEYLRSRIKFNQTVFLRINN